MKRFAWVVLGLMGMVVLAPAVPPAELDYQGKVLVNDVPFTGPGYFKFAIANEDGSANQWANDGTAVGEPSGFLTNEVFNGVFSTVLGTPPMSPLNPGIFSLDTGLYLRVWFSTTTSGFSEMLPAQKVVSAPYALNAGLVGGLTATEIQDSSVVAATNAITLDGAVTGPPHNNSLGTSVVFDQNVSAGADIEGAKIQAGSLTNRGTLQIASGSTGTEAVATGHPYLNSYGAVNTLAAGAPNSTLSVVGVSPVYVSNQAPNVLQIGLTALPALSLSALDNVIWVATNGTPVGPGTVDKPYDTPSAGYIAAVARYGSQPAAVLVAAGSYAGGLAMMAGNVHLIGIGRPELAGAVNISALPPPGMTGGQRVENMVFKAPVVVAASGGGVKFYNSKFAYGLTLVGSSVEVQNCSVRMPNPNSAALVIGGVEGVTRHIGIYHSGVYVTQPLFPALQVNGTVNELEVLWCELANDGGGPAVHELATDSFAGLHLYAHNWIRGPAPDSVGWAFKDQPGLSGPTIGFYNNTVYGNVGQATPQLANYQYYGNNMVHGRINHSLGLSVGWNQAGSGSGADPANNTEHQTSLPLFAPYEYRD